MKKKTILIILSAIVLFGFIFALILNTQEIGGCTKKGCACREENAQFPCNDCTKTNYYYAAFLINIGKTCSGKEIIICENGVQTGRIVEDLADCETFISIVGQKIKINY